MSIPIRSDAELRRRLQNLSDADIEALYDEVFGSGYARYADDPVRFGIEVLRESYTDDVSALIRSVVTHRRTIARSANAVGKSHAAGAAAWWWYKCHPESQVILLAAPPIANLETKLWGELMARTRRVPELLLGERVRHLHISRSPLDFIRGIAIPQDADAARIQASIAGSHRAALLYIVDEGDGVPPAVYDAIESCMTGGRNRLLVLFNPRSEAGPLADMERRGEAHIIELSAFRHPNVVSGQTRIPGAVDRETTLRRIREWTRPIQPGQAVRGDTFDVPHWLADGDVEPGAREIVDARFSVMVLGRYPLASTLEAYFDRAYLARRRRLVEALEPDEVVDSGRLRGRLEIWEQPEPGERYVVGADVAEGLDSDGTDHDYHAACVLRETTRTQVAAYHAREGCDPADFGRDLAAIGLHYNTADIVVERNSHGILTLHVLEEDGYPRIYRQDIPAGPDRPHSADRTLAGFRTTAQSKAMVDDALADAIRRSARAEMDGEPAAQAGGITLTSVRTIDECLQYSKLPGGRAGARRGHDDEVRAVGLANWLVEQRWSRTRMTPLRRKAPETACGARW